LSYVNGPALTGTGAAKRFTLSGLTLGIHYLAIQQQVASTFRPLGFESFAAGSASQVGVSFARIFYSGSGGFDWIREDGYAGIFPNGLDKAIYLSGTTSPPPTISGVFDFPTKLDLAVICLDLMGNDMNVAFGLLQGAAAGVSASPQSSYEAVRRICMNLRRANPAISFQFLIPSIPDGVYSELTAANTVANAWVWKDWKKQGYFLADEFTGMLYDMDEDVGPTGVTKGYQTQANGGFHLTDLGHQRAADVLSERW
jgi:hypothetical protein